jgi:hypothetical protein
MKGGIFKMKFVDMINKSESQCPIYGNCRTGRDLPPEFCARYRCNTYFKIDTIDIGNRINYYLANRPHNSNGNSCMFEMNGPRVETDIAKIVQKAIQEYVKKLGKF